MIHFAQKVVGKSIRVFTEYKTKAPTFWLRLLFGAPAEILPSILSEYKRVTKDGNNAIR